MKNTRASQPFLPIFVAVVLLITGIPPVLGRLGVSFASPEQGGPGAHFAGLIFGDTMVRFDLVTLGLAGLIVLLTVLNHRASASRFSVLLGVTCGLGGLMAIQVVPGAVLPDGTTYFFESILGAMSYGRLGGAAILLWGLLVIRWGHATDRRIALAQLMAPGVAIAGLAWYAMATLAGPDQPTRPELNLLGLLMFIAAVLTLRKELHHHRLRFFGHAVLVAFFPQAVAQILMIGGTTVFDEAFHIANLLRWFAWLIPAAGLGIDYISTFYARGLSVEMRYLRTVIDSIPHFIYARDAQGRFTLVNQTVADFYGLRVHEIEGRHLMDVHEDVQQCREWLAEDRETLQRRRKCQFTESVASRNDGCKLWINSIKTPLQSLLGIDDQVLGVSIDVSQQHRAEQALAEALQAAKASNRAKSEFLANMSHEIRTPMNCVIGLTDLLKEMDPTPRQQQYLDMIGISGTTLLSLINDVLDISKIEAGHLELDLVDTDLHTLVEETVGQIAFTAQTKGLEVVCRLAPGVPTSLMLDPGRVRQVLTNLLNNAAKFTQAGHIYLNIEPVGEHDGKLDLCFQVTDTGIGIAADALPRIFDKFTQAEAGTTRRYGGTGLGLSISQHLVELMGGRITATSEVGVGTTFSFTIPLEATNESSLPAPDGPEHRVLVVSDHHLGAEVLSEQLRSLGHVSRVAVGCDEALEAFEPAAGQEPWSAVLVDQGFFDRGLPRMSARLQELGPLRRPRAFLLANLSSPHRDADLARAGFDGALSKPVRLSQLAAKLNESQRPQATPAVVPARPAAVDPDVDPATGPRLLLAEDNPFNQKVAVAMLRLLGCQVDVAGTGVQAVDMARRHAYAAVLMDCQMPVMDGYEATRRIRRLPEPYCHTTIVAMTANALSGDRRACFDAGMNEFLSKPITRDMLRQMLQKLGVETTEGARPAEPAPLVS